MKTSKDKNKISDQALDDFFRNQLADHSVQPKASNWTHIRRWSRLSFLRPLIKTRLAVYGTAALLLLLFVLHFLMPIESSPVPCITDRSCEAPALASAIDKTGELKNKTYVLDLEQDPPEEMEEKTVPREIIDEAIEDYLNFLLADEDEFRDQIDSAGIANSLDLAEQLPIDEMFETIPELPEPKVYTILAPRKTQITLPHRFVKSEKEVEDYLAHYERKQRKKQQY